MAAAAYSSLYAYKHSDIALRNGELKIQKALGLKSRMLQEHHSDKPCSINRS